MVASSILVAEFKLLKIKVLGTKEGKKSKRLVNLSKK